MSDDRIDKTFLIHRAWLAQSSMLNRAEELEKAAERLRKAAKGLYEALDPPDLPEKALSGSEEE